MGRLLMLLAAEALAVTATWRLAGAHPLRLAGTVDPPPEEVLLAVVHQGARVAACWLLAGTVHEVVVAFRRAGRSGVATQAVVPTWVQRIVARAVGTALVLGVAAGPAAAAAPTTGPAPVEVVVAPPVPVLDGVDDPAPSPQPPTPEPPTTPPPSDPSTSDRPPPDAPAPAPPAADASDLPAPGTSDGADDAVGGAADPTHVIAAGENLWVIARAVVTAAADRPDPDRPPSDREVHAYWVRLIAANQVRSGDPDLVFPGEVLTLPAVEASS